MADGLLAAGGLGSEVMGPEPECTGWAAAEEPAPLEKGEYPLWQLEEPPPSGRPYPPRLGRRDPPRAPAAEAFRTRPARAAGWLREAPSPCQDLKVGRYPGQVPFSPPSLASASSRPESVGPDQEFPPWVFGWISGTLCECVCGERTHLFSCILEEIVDHTALP